MHECQEGIWQKEKSNIYPDKSYFSSLPERYMQAYSSLREENRCYMWSVATLKALERDGYDGLFRIRFSYDTGETWLWDEFEVLEHTYLETQRTRGKYIADGTAGQFLCPDSEYHNGYFGYLDDAPIILQKIYRYNDGKYNISESERP